MRSSGGPSWLRTGELREASRVYLRGTDFQYSSPYGKDIPYQEYVQPT